MYLGYDTVTKQYLRGLAGAGSGSSFGGGSTSGSLTTSGFTMMGNINMVGTRLWVWTVHEVGIRPPPRNTWMIR